MRVFSSAPWYSRCQRCLARPATFARAAATSPARPPSCSRATPARPHPARPARPRFPRCARRPSRRPSCACAARTAASASASAACCRSSRSRRMTSPAATGSPFLNQDLGHDPAGRHAQRGALAGTTMPLATTARIRRAAGADSASVGGAGLRPGLPLSARSCASTTTPPTARPAMTKNRDHDRKQLAMFLHLNSYHSVLNSDLRGLRNLEGSLSSG